MKYLVPFKDWTPVHEAAAHHYDHIIIPILDQVKQEFELKEIEIEEIDDRLTMLCKGKFPVPITFVKAESGDRSGGHYHPAEKKVVLKVQLAGWLHDDLWQWEKGRIIDVLDHELTHANQFRNIAPDLEFAEDSDYRLKDFEKYKALTIAKIREHVKPEYIKQKFTPRPQHPDSFNLDDNSTIDFWGWFFRMAEGETAARDMIRGLIRAGFTDVEDLKLVIKRQIPIKSLISKGFSYIWKVKAYYQLKEESIYFKRLARYMNKYVDWLEHEQDRRISGT